MLFNELRFVIFFVVVFILYWVITVKKLRILVLLVASFVFYGAWDWRFLGLLLFVISITYFAQSSLFNIKNNKERGLIVGSSVTLLLLTLGLFKYYNFFSESLTILLQDVGLSVSQPLLNIILPVGVSFYIFQAIGYIIDVSRREFEEPEDLLSVAFFIAFFPQLVAGPIVRAQDFFPQIKTHHRLRDIPWSGIIVLFVGGFFKKAIIADNLSTYYVDPVFSNPGQYGNGDIIFAVFAYAAQIYCDFSGYSDMAIAVSRSFGFQLPLNFMAPYFSTSITAFWRRWHMSLSQWLRDYLYISLGGSRAGNYKTYRNLMLTMVLGGLWHGASWNFLIWGYIHGAVLTIERVFDVPKFVTKNLVSRLVAGFLTFYIVCIAWVFFRSSNLEVSIFIISAMLGGKTVGATHFNFVDWTVLSGLLMVHYVIFRFQFGQMVSRLPALIVAALAGLIIAALMPFLPTDAKPFIYFQF